MFRTGTFERVTMHLNMIAHDACVMGLHNATMATRRGLGRPARPMASIAKQHTLMVQDAHTIEGFIEDQVIG